MPFDARLIAVAVLSMASATLVAAQPQGGPYDNGQNGSYNGDYQQGGPRDDRGYDDDRGDRDGRDRDRRDDRRDDRRADRGSVTVFADDDFRGRSMTIDRPIRRLSEVGMDDKISSIDVRGGAWMVCTDDDFRGRCTTIDRSVRKLGRLDLDDKISSMRPARGRY